MNSIAHIKILRFGEKVVEGFIWGTKEELGELVLRFNKNTPNMRMQLDFDDKGSSHPLEDVLSRLQAL